MSGQLNGSTSITIIRALNQGDLLTVHPHYLPMTFEFREIPSLIFLGNVNQRQGGGWVFWYYQFLAGDRIIEIEEGFIASTRWLVNHKDPSEN